MGAILKAAGVDFGNGENLVCFMEQG